MLWKSPIELQCRRAHLKELSKVYPASTIGHPKVCWSLNPYKLGIVYKTSNYKSIQAFCAPNFERWLEAFYSLSGLKLGVKKAHEYSYNLEFL